QGLPAGPPPRLRLLGILLGRRGRGRPFALELVAQVTLAATGHGVGSHELVDEEVEDEAPHPDERPARSAQQPPHHHLRTAGGQVEVGSHPTRFAAATTPSGSAVPARPAREPSFPAGGRGTPLKIRPAARRPWSAGRRPRAPRRLRRRAGAPPLRLRSSPSSRPAIRPARLPSLATNQVWGRAVTDQLAATPPRRPCW